MKSFLNCQKVKQIIVSFLFLFSVSVHGATVEGIVEGMGELENGYDIKLKNDKRFFSYSNAASRPDSEIELLKESKEKGTTVKLSVDDREITKVESTTLREGSKVADLAPSFTAKTHENKDFSLSDRKGKWTVLYFYPKADTPGCTKQACAFRDSIKVIRDLNADVFGISTDSVKDQAAFHKKHNLSFTLLADPTAVIAEKYDAKVFGVKMAKRWTFIIGPDLRIRHIDEGVDPVLDAANVAKKLKELQAKK